MDKQSIIIIAVALIVAVWVGFQSYDTFPYLAESIAAYSETASQIGVFKTLVLIFVKIIPGLFFIGGIGLLFLQKWGLRLTHTTLALDIAVNLFRLSRHIYNWFVKNSQIELSIQEYFFAAPIMMILGLFIVELLLINLTMQLRNQLID